MKTNMRAWIVSIVSVPLALGLAGCAAQKTVTTTTAPAAATSTPSTEAAPFDAAFIDSMIVHHEGAISMAKEAQSQAQRPEIQTLAAAIVTAQQAEIDQMRAWRQAWYPDLPPTAGLPMSMGMMEVAQGETPYDIRFIEAMIPHHEGAIAMAEEVKVKSQRPELLTLADAIIAAQTSEIAQMRQWREVWAPAQAPADADASILPGNPMLMGNRLTLDLIKSPQAARVVIHADDGGQPGEVLGFAPVPAGVSKNVTVELTKAGSKLIAMLHVDAGEAGKYEFPGDDVPLIIDGQPVIAAFGAMIH